MTPATSNEQTRFASILPRIEERLERGFTCDPELKEELIAIGVSHAFLLFLSATRRNKCITAGTLAFYAARMTRSGRPVGSAMSKYDVFSTANGKIEPPLSLSDNDLSELLKDQKNIWTPADQVAFKVDWTEFLSERDRRDGQIVGMLAKGYLRSEAAEAVGLSRPAVTYRMDRMQEDWEERQDLRLEQGI